MQVETGEAYVTSPEARAELPSESQIDQLTNDILEQQMGIVVQDLQSAADVERGLTGKF